MKDSLDLSCVPYEEPCAQVGNPDHDKNAIRECRAYIGQLRRVFGPEPEGCRLKLKSNPHDFGSYLSVICVYDDTNPVHVEYAYGIDAKAPANWDEQARTELESASFTPKLTIGAVLAHKESHK